jgi:hypothetical protein
VGRLLWPGGCPKVGFLAIFERSFCYAMQKSFQLRRNRLVDVNHSTDARRSRLGQGSCRRRNCLGPGTRAVAGSTKEGCASQLSAGAAAVPAQEQSATHRFESAASDSAKDGRSSQRSDSAAGDSVIKTIVPIGMKGAQPYRPRPSIDAYHCKDMPSEECAALTRPFRFRKAASVVAPFGRTFSSIGASSFFV